MKVEYYYLYEVLESMSLHKNCGPIEDYVEMGQQRSYYCYDKIITARVETLNVTSWHCVEGMNLSMMHLSVVRQADKEYCQTQIFFSKGIAENRGKQW